MTYCPWADAGRRLPHVHIAVRDIAPARGAAFPDHHVILIDQRLTRTEGRCVLAHEVAHLDLGHRPTHIAHFDIRQEREAGVRAARLLITAEAFADALAWAQDERELAAELDVDVDTVMVRKATLSSDEIRIIEDRLASIEHAA